MGLFYSDISSDESISWDQLLRDLNEQRDYSPFCYESNFYKIFRHIIVSMLLEREIVLLDSDFSGEEIHRLIGNINLSSSKIDLTGIVGNLTTKEKLVERLMNVSPTWKITLFTSGTTGTPKKISHTYSTITRFVKVSEKHLTSVWGFAYNPTHIAGLQVFFQALLNGNTLIRLFGISYETIFLSINRFNITNISATPTFYRLLLPIYGVYPSVKYITSGGEKFDEKAISMLKSGFPNAKITNVYASTEAGSLLASDGNEFSIKKEFEHLIQIDQDELVIHRSLMGQNDVHGSDWYKTGDLVEVISMNPMRFKFLSRKNEMINVGGYKVNPIEVEETIRDIFGIVDVRVFAKSNSVLGNIICCEIVRNDTTLDESTIRNQLKSKLQEYKIPRMMRFVEELSITRTGKIKRS